MTAIGGAVAVVSGAGSGIGAAIARELATRGTQVVVADADVAAADQVAAEIGGTAVGVDAADRSAVTRLAAETVTRYGRVDILVTGTTAGPRGTIAELTESDWRRLLGADLGAVIHGVGVFLPLLGADGRAGHIVVVPSSAAGEETPSAGDVVVEAATAALVERLESELRAADSPVHVALVEASDDAGSRDPDAIARSVCDAIAQRLEADG